MESSRKDDRLTAALEALRPVPAPAFAAELDERAATGFSRRESSAAAPWAALADRLRELTPRQVLLPSAATAFVAVLLATVVVTTSQPGSRLERPAGGPQATTGALLGATSGGAAARSAKNGSAAQGFATPHASAEAATESESAPSEGGPVAQPEEELSLPGAAPLSGAAHRDVERSAQVLLGAAPDAVSGDASRVFEAVHAAHGIVLRSSVNQGSEGAASARFELLVPSARLDDALGAISEIDEVLSRRDGTTDITAPTVGATERLQDSQARIDSLLGELAGAETEIERETIEAKLRSERRRAAVLRAQLGSLRHRASFSHVSVRIEADAASSSGGGAWGLGNAAGDAGHVLAVAAGVTLVGLAVLGPLALIALLCWAAYRAWVRLARRRALG
jgi:Domain of unknown function (DUF4349)